MILRLQTSLRRLPSFDAIAKRLTETRLTRTEEELLNASHWALGQDGHLREDDRFRQTPWGGWMLAEDYLANEALYRELHATPTYGISLQTELEKLDTSFKRRCVFCSNDPRFVLRKEEIRLAASELSEAPFIQDEASLHEKYITHLPIYSLKAAAASLPAGEWGRQAQEESIQALGWLAVSLPRRSLNERMFVAQIEGHSMDNGQSGLVDGGYAVFEAGVAGTKQGLNVLVRGSFHDPETGSYAVKKYVADPRDPEGRHSRITLVSLHPDKHRYPPIELDARSDEAVTVVARVVQALASDEYLRQPKALPQKGRRDLTSAGGLRQQKALLAKRAEQFFSGLPLEEEDDPLQIPLRPSSLLCLEFHAGGLHIEIGPLKDLPTFVKFLVIQTARGPLERTPATSLRSRPLRIPILPSQGFWSLQAEGFEEEDELHLSEMTQRLEEEKIAVFRVGADAIGRLQKSPLLSRGQEYRLLLPPTLSFEETWPALQRLPDGWGLFELSLTEDLSPSLVQFLERAGLELGVPLPSLRFALPLLPDTWKTTAKGEAYAFFGMEDTPSPKSARSIVLRSEGYDAEAEGEARLFIQGPTGIQSVPLPTGDSSLVEIAGLTEGKYFGSLLHTRTKIPATHLAFEVGERRLDLPSARSSIGVKGSSTYLCPNTCASVWRGDLATLHAADLAIQGPPGWKIRLLWSEMRQEYLATWFLGASGSLDTQAFLTSIHDRQQHSLLGDLLLDWGELGSAKLEHERRPSLDVVVSSLRTLLKEKAAWIQQRPGEFAYLLPFWFQPMIRLLGYDLEPLSDMASSPAPPIHAAIVRLLATERHSGKFHRSCKRILVLLSRLEPRMEEAVLAWIDDRCMALGVETALFSTGLMWTSYRRRLRLPLPLWDLRILLAEGGDPIPFLREAAEGL